MLKHGLVTFVFDDGNTTDYTVMKPVFDKKREVACTAIVTDNIGKEKCLTAEQLIEMENDGWEILSHSKTHPLLTELGEEDVRDELLLSKQALEELGLTVNNFVYPSHMQNPFVRQITKDYYRSARGGEQGINPVMIDPYYLSSKIINLNAQLSVCKRYVDKAKKEKKWMIFYLHATNIGNAVKDADIFMESLIYYMQRSGVRIVTINQALDLIQ